MCDRRSTTSGKHTAGPSSESTRATKQTQTRPLGSVVERVIPAFRSVHKVVRSIRAGVNPFFLSLFVSIPLLQRTFFSPIKHKLSFDGYRRARSTFPNFAMSDIISIGYVLTRMFSYQIVSCAVVRSAERLHVHLCTYARTFFRGRTSMAPIRPVSCSSIPILS